MGRLKICDSEGQKSFRQKEDTFIMNNLFQYIKFFIF